MILAFWTSATVGVFVVCGLLIAASLIYWYLEP